MNFGAHILGTLDSYRFVLCQLLIWSSLGGFAGRSVAELPGRPPDGPLRYRRILLPPDQLETWSKEDVRYLPLNRDEFRRRMKRVGRASLGAPPDDLPLIGRAFYEARLDEASLLRGTARLEIMHRGDHPALLSLAPCELAISAVHWDAEQEGEVPLGNSSEGELEVVVDRSATLGFAWTFRGTRRSGDRLIFELQLPDSASKQMRVELPSDLILRVPHGRVVQETVDGSGSTEAAKRWWRVELGRRNRVSLEVASEATQHVPPQWPAVRQRLIYHVSPRGLELTAQLTMDSGKKFEQRFPILVDPSLQVVDVMVGKRHLPWRVATKGAEESRTILVDLSGPIPDDGQVVRLVARAPLVTEGRWRLPMARTAAAGWESGKIELVVASPLTLNRLELSDCRQVGWEPIATPQQGESFDIEAFSPSASVDVTIAWLEAKRTMRTATTLSLGPREVTATTIVSVKVASGRYFDLEARVGPHWMIDAVASNPSDALAGWLHQRAGQTDGQLVVNLSRALVPGRALQLTITGRLQRSGLARSLRIGELEMLHFRQRRSPLYLLRSADPFQ
ncbi:MAG: hypothetical protein ACC645_13810, partial [Pirellulales bacterium]